MASGHEEEAGFWPGYVAAVAGLVQGLLIMAMALGISIYALGKLAVAEEYAEQAAKDQAARDKAAAAAAAVAARDVAGPWPVGPRPASASTLPPPLLQPRPVGLPVATALVGTISFYGDAVDLPDTSAGDVAAMVARHRAAGAVRWRLTLAAPLADPRARRAGYLRLLSIRRALLAAGVDVAEISAGLVEGGSGGEGPALAELRPFDAAGAPVLAVR